MGSHFKALTVNMKTFLLAFTLLMLGVHRSKADKVTSCLQCQSVTGMEDSECIDGTAKGTACATDAVGCYVQVVAGIKGRLNRLPAAGCGDMFVATVKKGKPELRKKVMPAVVIRQRKPFRRKDGVFIYFEDNAGVIVNVKGEMKGSAITGPVSKECAELWPRIASNAGSIQ